MSSTKSPNDLDLQADIVVVGAGGAGLPAALSASEAGAKGVVSPRGDPALTSAHPQRAGVAQAGEHVPSPPAVSVRQTVPTGAARAMPVRD